MRNLRLLSSTILASLSTMLPALAWAQSAEQAEMGYGWLLFRMIVLLAIVCIFAYVVLRWGVRRFVAPDRQVGPMSVVARLPVEPRRSILLIKVGDRCMVVGSSEAGMTSLGEIPADELDLESPEPTTSFADVMARFRPAGDASDEAADEADQAGEAGEADPADDKMFHVKQEAS